MSSLLVITTALGLHGICLLLLFYALGQHHMISRLFLPPLCCSRHTHLAPAAEDVRDAAYDAAIDTKKGAKKAVIRAESATEEGKAKSRGFFSRLFGRGKVRMNAILP
jgi:hypothetical protein